MSHRGQSQFWYNIDLVWLSLEVVGSSLNRSLNLNAFFFDFLKEVVVGLSPSSSRKCMVDCQLMRLLLESSFIDLFLLRSINSERR